MQRLQLKEQCCVLCLHWLTIRFSAGMSKALGMKLVIKAASVFWWQILNFLCASCAVGSVHSGVNNATTEQKPFTHLYPHTYTFCLHLFLPPNPQASRCCCQPCSAEALQCRTAWSDDNKHLRHNLGLRICIFAWFNLRGKYANVC